MSFDGIFTAALPALYGAFGRRASYLKVSGGPAFDVLLILNFNPVARPDAADLQAPGGAVQVLVRRAEVQSPRRGDTVFLYDSEKTYRVDGVDPASGYEAEASMLCYEI